MKIYLSVKLGSLLILLFLFSSTLQAQQKPAYDSTKGFYEYQKKMNEYFMIKEKEEKKDIEEEDGEEAEGEYEQWKRLEWYFSTRLDAAGKLPNLQRAKQDAIQNSIQNNFLSRTDNPGEAEATDAFLSSWSQVGPTLVNTTNKNIGRVNRLAFDNGNANNIWAATTGGGLWSTANGGISWEPLTDGLPNSNLSGVAVNQSNTNIIYILTGDADGGGSTGGGDGGCCSFGKFSTGVLKSTDAGTTWNYTGLKWDESDGYLGYKLIMHPSDFNVLFVATNTGIFKTTNGGASWANVLLQGYINNNVYDIEFMPNNPQIMYAGVDGGKFYRSTDGGITWAKLFDSPDTYASRMSISVTPANPAAVFLLIANSNPSTFTFGGIFYSPNMGASGSWEIRASQLPNVFSGDGVALVGKQEKYDHSFAVNPFDFNKLVTGGISIFRSTNGGTTLNYIEHDNANYHVDVHELVYPPNGSTLYAATDGGIYKSTNDGSTWMPINGNMAITQYYRISVSNASPVYVLGGAQDNGSHIRTNNTGIFNPATGQDGTDNAISVSNPSVMYTSSDKGNFYRSSNSGSSFSAAFCNDAILLAQGINVSHFWVTNIEVSPTNSEIIFLGHSTVLKGLNIGSVWTFIKIGGNGTMPVSGRTVLKVAPSNANIIYAGDNNYLNDGVQKLWRTTDGGTSWDTLKVPYTSKTFTRLTVNPDDPEDIWLVYGGFNNGYKVFRSVNAGVTWTNISGSLPNVPINCIVYDDNNGNPDDALYIGTDIGVFYRDNTLGDWIPFSNGLPVVEVTDLEINESSGLLRAGTYGRGVWQTALYSASCAVDLSFVTNSHPHSEPAFYSVTNTISSLAVIVGAGANIQYKAGQRITLTTGFEIKSSSGAKFTAYIGACPGGGIPPGYNRSLFNGLPGYLKSE